MECARATSELPQAAEITRQCGAALEFGQDGAFDEDMDDFELVETVHWLNRRNAPCAPQMTSWPTSIGQSSEALVEENFVDPELLHRLKRTKAAVFEWYDVAALRRARYYANRCELVGSGPFMNRAAVKMANIDARTEFMFSRPTELVSDDDILCFADICSGPGGFSEYMLWRRGWLSRGFGMTLRGDDDFRLNEVVSTLSALNFSTHYGVGGMDGDGDVYREDNQQAFTQYVLENTEGCGVHVVMADGGFDVKGKEAMQEVLCLRLYLCQFLLALRLLRPGGHFVCKLFDVFTNFSAGLLFLISLAFGNTAFIKPNTSRPGNSERYIVCKSRRDDVTVLCDYLRRVNLHLSRAGDDCDSPVSVQLVPLDVICRDAEFTRFLTDTNNRLCERQTAALRHMALYASALHPSSLCSFSSRRRRQLQLQARDFCLQAWQLPETAEDSCQQLHQLHELSAKQLVKRLSWTSTIPQLLDGVGHFASFNNCQSGRQWCLQYQTAAAASCAAYCVMPCCSNVSEPLNNRLCLLMGRGHGSDSVWFRPVISSSSKHGNRWRQLSVLLPVATLLLVESTDAPSGECAVFHVLDAVFLSGDDVTRLSFQLRRRLLQLFLGVAVRCRDSCLHGYSCCPPGGCNSCVTLRLKPVCEVGHLCDSSRSSANEVNWIWSGFEHGISVSDSVDDPSKEQLHPPTGGLIINTNLDFVQMWKTAIYWPWSNE